MSFLHSNTSSSAITMMAAPQEQQQQHSSSYVLEKAAYWNLQGAQFLQNGNGKAASRYLNQALQMIGRSFLFSDNDDAVMMEDQSQQDCMIPTIVKTLPVVLQSPQDDASNSSGFYVYNQALLFSSSAPSSSSTSTAPSFQMERSLAFVSAVMLFNSALGYQQQGHRAKACHLYHKVVAVAQSATTYQEGHHHDQASSCDAMDTELFMLQLLAQNNRTALLLQTDTGPSLQHEMRVLSQCLTAFRRQQQQAAAISSCLLLSSRPMSALLMDSRAIYDEVTLNVLIPSIARAHAAGAA